MTQIPSYTIAQLIEQIQKAQIQKSPTQKSPTKKNPSQPSNRTKPSNAHQDFPPWNPAQRTSLCRLVRMWHQSSPTLQLKATTSTSSPKTLILDNVLHLLPLCQPSFTWPYLSVSLAEHNTALPLHWNNATLRIFAADCAARILPLLREQRVPMRIPETIIATTQQRQQETHHANQRTQRQLKKLMARSSGPASALLEIVRSIQGVRQTPGLTRHAIAFAHGPHRAQQEKVWQETRLWAYLLKLT